MAVDLCGAGALADELSKYKGRRVLVSGHTGFKGSWMCALLEKLGAEIAGYSVDVPTEPSLYELADIGKGMKSLTGDVRDLDALGKAFLESRPEIVIHMAAQPIVKTGYAKPAITFDVNLMGTVNMLECARGCDSVRSIIIVTTDKVYDAERGPAVFDETCRLGGYDPYAASKACAEIAVSAYRNSYFSHAGVAVSTMRAGNCIGGGDFGADRLIPDCIRAYTEASIVGIRNPKASRPYQHVLEPVTCYLITALRQIEDKSIAGVYNIGPEDSSVTNEDLVKSLCREIEKVRKNDADNTDDFPLLTCEVSKSTCSGVMHEAEALRIDSSKIKEKLGWQDRWGIDEAVKEIAEFAEIYRYGGNIREHVDSCIDTYLSSENV